MNGENNCSGNEFLGETSKYCIDEEYVWFYDEISGGLYRLDINNYIVEVILTPMEIHQKKIVSVMQVLKWGNEIYLIPYDISHEWLIYDIESKQLRRILRYDQSYEFGGAVNIGTWIYLLPGETYRRLAIVEAGTLKVKEIITDWCRNDIKESGASCWGESIFENTIVFPIMGRSEIIQVQEKQIIELPLHIKKPIYSVSLCKDGIWVLPSEGNMIFLVDRSGECMDSVEIRTGCCEDMTERFMRIVSIDRYVYLFPRRGGQILALDTNSKSWAAVGEKEAPPYRSLYQKIRNNSYWGYYYNKERLYTLPLQYRLGEIDAEKRSINYKTLRCATAQMERQYMSWICWFNEKGGSTCFIEWEKNAMKNFLDITLESNTTSDKRLVGENIWKVINQ